MLGDRFVIAHRGASGYLPEHTLAGFALAHAQGADYVEPDVVLSADGTAVVCHDWDLGHSTDAPARYPEKAGPDGEFLSRNFSREEIGRLRVRLADGVRPGRFSVGDIQFPVPLLDELAAMLAELNRLSNSRVGLAIELKPAMIATPADFVDAMASMLDRVGAAAAALPMCLQCFAPEVLEAFASSDLQHLPRVQLLGERRNPWPGLSPSALRSIRQTAVAVGVSRGLLDADPGLVQRAHAEGLAVHAWTLRADDSPDESRFAAQLQHYALELDVDGITSDHPDKAAAFMDRHHLREQNRHTRSVRI